MRVVHFLSRDEAATHRERVAAAHQHKVLATPFDTMYAAKNGSEHGAHGHMVLVTLRDRELGAAQGDNVVTPQHDTVRSVQRGRVLQV